MVFIQKAIKIHVYNHENYGFEKRRTLVKYIITMFLALVVGVLLESWRENRIFRVKRYCIPISDKKEEKKAKEEKLKIVFLSDLHDHTYGNENDVLYEAVWKEKPDVILIGGDMLIGKHHVALDAARSFCSKLPKIAPVYYAMGNHEQRMKTYPERYGDAIERYIQSLKNEGIHILDNDSTEIEFSGRWIRVTGVNLPMECYKHHDKIGKKDIETFVGKSSKEAYQILLAHDPGHFAGYKEWGADLVLAGHLHGGVARIPGWRGVITPHLHLFPKYSGEMTTEDSHTMIVSKGLGTHTIPFRIFNYPEIVVFEL